MGDNNVAKFSILLLLAAACTGTVTDPGGSDGPPTTVDPTLPSPARCAERLGQPIAPVASGPVRRLGPGEYAATLADLFPGAELPSANLTAAAGFFEYANTTVPPVRADVTEQVSHAGDVAAVIGADLNRHTGCDPADAACLQMWIEDLLPRAFRRPATADERALYVDLFAELEADPELTATDALTSTLESVLISPPFIHRLEVPDGAAQRRLDGYEIATRLSYLLWGTMPDEALFTAAGDGSLGTDEGVAQQLDRMLANTRAADGFRSFGRQWLDFEAVLGVTKSPEQYPDFDDGLAASMAEESERFFSWAAGLEGGSVRRLLTSRTSFVDAPLAGFYGVAAPAGDWQQVELPADERSGLLTRGTFLTHRAGAERGSPPLRGVFVNERFLCVEFGDRPDDADVSEPVAEPGEPRTNRELFEARTASSALCTACHRVIDPIGYAFENFDAIGQYRAQDNGVAVDATAEVVGTDFDGTYENADALSDALASSEQVSVCVSKYMLEHAIGRRLRNDEQCAPAAVHEGLESQDTVFREMLLQIATSELFTTTIASEEP